MQRNIGWLLLTVALAFGFVGCDEDSDDGATNTDAGGLDDGDGNDSGEGTGGDTSQEWDTFRGEPCEDVDPDSQTYDYGADYPPGPYGFKGGVCWSEGLDSFEWKGGGDTVHNFCLPDQNDEEFCVSDLLNSDYDLLILAFDALWCPVCQMMASMEEEYLAKLRAAGFKPIVVSIIENGMAQGSFPTVDDAMEWHTTFERTSPTLYDPEWVWADKSMVDVWRVGRKTQGMPGFPYHFYINLKTMRVWDSFEGWVDKANLNEFVEMELVVLDEIKGKPGS